MRIGELARRAEVSTSRIRFYEAHGLLPKAGRGENGYRDYADGVVQTLRLIDGAQTLGFSLTEIRQALAKAGDNPPSMPDMLEALRCKLVSLDQHIAVVAERRRLIVELIDEFETGCPPLP